jgi:hypothetical protein
VSRQGDRALFDTLLSILTATPGGTGDDAHETPDAADDESAVELDEATWHRLGAMGLVVSAPDATPDLTFACELPCARGTRDREATQWARIAHPALAIQRGPELPPSVAVLLRGASLPLAQRFPIAWVTEPVTGVPAPFAITGRHAAALDTLSAGRPAPDDLPDDIRADLAAAEILVGADFASRREAEWDARLRVAHRSYAERGWAIVRGLLPAAQLPALRSYFRAYVAAGYARRGDPQVPLRWSGHNQHFVTLIHAGLNRVMSRVTGCPTKPSYSYFASYMPGAVLSRHRDRAQCKYSVSLQLDAEPDGREPWPLHLEDLRGELATGLLEPGDGLCYRGCDLAHWRDELAAGQTSTSAFLHYVDSDFSGGLT